MTPLSNGQGPKNPQWGNAAGTPMNKTPSKAEAIKSRPHLKTDLQTYDHDTKDKWYREPILQ